MLQRLLATAFLASLTLSACTSGAGDVTAPASRMPTAQGASNLLGVDGNLVSSKLLGRTVGIPFDLTVTAAIGPAGGTLSIPQVGFTLVVPPGAVSSTVNFSATALAGIAVAYEFAPHGITFLKPLHFRQRLAGTSGSLASLEGGYFQNRAQVNVANLTASLNETMPATIVQSSSASAGGSSVVFDIWHFSGYLVSSGRK
ncbi:MAG: hypothetical protein ABIZ91_13235 [Gemmatimonadaceae bacterium]